MTAIHSRAVWASLCANIKRCCHLYSSLPLKLARDALLFSPPLTLEDWKANEWGAEGFLLLLCCSVLFAQMELYDNQKSANIVSPPHTQRGWEAINHLKEAFLFPPQEIQIYLFWSYLFFSFKNLMCYSWVYIRAHTHRRKHSLKIYSSAISFTKDKSSVHMSIIFSSKGSLTGVVPHHLANMSFRQLIWLWWWC